MTDWPELPEGEMETASDEYGSPPEYVEAARRVMGSIELDPASNPISQLIVKAWTYWTIEDDALSPDKDWDAFDTIYMNHAFSKSRKFVHRLRHSLLYRPTNARAFGEVERQAIILCNSATAAGWYQSLLRDGWCFCLPAKRIAFLGQDNRPVKGNRQPQTVFYWGPNEEGFRNEFSAFGHVRTKDYRP